MDSTVEKGTAQHLEHASDTSGDIPGNAKGLAVAFEEGMDAGLSDAHLAPPARRGSGRSFRHGPRRVRYARQSRFKRADRSVARPVIPYIGLGSPVIALAIPKAIVP